MNPCIAQADKIAEIKTPKKSEIMMDKKTRELVEILKEISAIPRCSGNEKTLRDWLVKWAENNRLEARVDTVGNVVIRVPSSKDYEAAPGIVLQGHMDMVCEKTPESNHDFSKDPISFVYDGDWLTAHNTTLGADNGIGIALCLSIATDESITHPSLELLFTVEEETGLKGAESVQPGFIEGKLFINIDSEDEGVLTVGSAGGRMLLVEYPIATEPIPDTLNIYTLQVSGLFGGHSGVDIHKHRANANKILATALNTINSSFDIKLLSLKGGSQSNAIPRDAAAVIGCETALFPELQSVIEKFEQNVQGEYASSDPSISVKLSERNPSDALQTVLGQKDVNNVIQLLLAIPDGVVNMSSEIEGLVETSNNVGTVKQTKNSIAIECFLRSSVTAELDELTSTIKNAATRFGAVVNNNGDFPPWEPNMESPLLSQCRAIYGNLFGKSPEVSVIHAGLECSVIGSKVPGLDMISIGPTIENPHSPDERLHIPSIGRVWEFLVAFLGSAHP